MSTASMSQLDYGTTDATAWNILETEFDPAKLHAQETVFTIGNGYLCTRGSFEEGFPGDQSATLIHGIFDDAPIVSTELVNCPNWLPLIIQLDDEAFRLDHGEILKYDRILNLKLGLLTRSIRWRSPNGHTLEFRFERFCSFADQHLMAIRCHITSIDFTGKIAIESGFEPHPTTVSIPHWMTLKSGGLKNLIWLSTETLHSGLELGLAAKLTVTKDNETLDVESNTTTLTASTQINPGQIITAEKIISIYTSRDTEFPLTVALRRLAKAPSYTTLFAAHITAWGMAWQNTDITIEGDPKAQISIRYNLFQLMIAAPRRDDRVSIPAKTLSGFAYRGHVFWDTEIFIVPFFALTQPAIAKNLLTYRYHTLPGARRKAKDLGYEGALYSWESAATGDEVTPRWVPGANGELIRIWCGDIEYHIAADVAYGVWQYWRITGDDEWMRDYGAEILLETAKFWASRVERNGERYEINDVIGPDENHEHVNNNAFTNAMAQWNLSSAIMLWDWLARSYPSTAIRLQRELDLNADRFSDWTAIAQNLTISPDAETNLIEQCDGFFDLIDVDLADYEPRSRSMQSLLGIEPTNQRQILKQPDVLMLLYLLRQQFDHKVLQANWDYYTPRTDHVYGSSLGPAVHAILACDLDKVDEAYEHFMRSALVDLEDVRGNAAEGIHAASAGGVWQAIVFGFAGVRMTEFGLIACPNLPTHWTRLKFRLCWQNQWVEFDLSQNGAVCETIEHSIQTEFAPL
ncbi:glycoside hydrolase family 65 protein [Leptolyngbya sp. NIES-2104]|uniref:glycoside hydrolase family 65 protein n=1 Tax=Leptolyngbya sp. NIES-2104 TaxID=1552121 RepID=UPI0006EC96DD|nr:glycoside hydrolase family 65 protein [Leptolyngbya sp. NIES-2104]GAP93879.1 maltose phosphorylase / trehalose phosphorylase [Leptolyngbya sp. NIES-2104]